MYYKKIILTLIIEMFIFFVTIFIMAVVNKQRQKGYFPKTRKGGEIYFTRFSDRCHSLSHLPLCMGMLLINPKYFGFHLGGAYSILVSATLLLWGLIVYLIVFLPSDVQPDKLSKKKIFKIKLSKKKLSIIYTIVNVFSITWLATIAFLLLGSMYRNGVESCRF